MKTLEEFRENSGHSKNEKFVMTEYFQLSSEVLIEIEHETEIGNFSLLNRCRHHKFMFRDLVSQS